MTFSCYIATEETDDFDFGTQFKFIFGIHIANIL